MTNDTKENIILGTIFLQSYFSWMSSFIDYDFIIRYPIIDLHKPPVHKTSVGEESTIILIAILNKEFEEFKEKFKDKFDFNDQLLNKIPCRFIPAGLI